MTMYKADEINGCYMECYTRKHMVKKGLKEMPKMMNWPHTIAT